MNKMKSKEDYKLLKCEEKHHFNERHKRQSRYTMR